MPVPQVQPSASMPPSPIRPYKKGLPKGLMIVVFLLVVFGVFAAIISKFVLPSFNSANQKEATLTWWGLWNDKSKVDALITEYKQAHPNVDIKYEFQSPQDYRERLANNLSRGIGPDIFRIHNTWTPMFTRYLSPLPETILTTQEFSSLFYPIASTDLSSGGEIVAIPLEFDSIALYINEEIFETFNKQVPQTWDELRSTAKELTIRDENGIIRQSGVALGITSNIDHWQEIVGWLMHQNKVDMKNPASDRTALALDFFSQFSRDDKVWDDTLPSSTVAFANGKLAMYFGPYSRVKEIKSQNPSLRFRVIPSPQLPKPDPKEPNIYYASYWAEAVNSESKNSAAAWEFLKFMSTRDSLEKLGQGEPYPRVDMQDLVRNDPFVGPFVLQGPEAKSWYLASNTHDGSTGINTKLSKVFEIAIKAIIDGDKPDKTLPALSTGIIDALADFGLARRPVATPK